MLFRSEAYIQEELGTVWDKILDAREAAAKALELARKEKIIGQSLEAEVELYVSPEWQKVLQPYADQLPMILIVSKATLKPEAEAPADAVTEEGVDGVRVMVHRAEGTKCERCWNYRDDVGQDADHPTICGRCATVLKSI